MSERIVGTMSKVYIFDVVLQWSSKISRRIAIRGDQTLHDLHETIVDAFERDDDHQYSFYIGVGTSKTRRRLDSASEYISPFSESDGYDAGDAKIEDLNLARTTKIEYLYDYGDEWWHKIKLVKVEDLADRKVKYPQIIAKEGDAPPQYPDLEDEE